MEINDEARRMNLVIGKENIDDDNAEDPCFMDAQVQDQLNVII